MCLWLGRSNMCNLTHASWKTLPCARTASLFLFWCCLFLSEHFCTFLLLYVIFLKECKIGLALFQFLSTGKGKNAQKRCTSTPTKVKLQSRYSGMMFLTPEWIALLESKFHFQIEDWNLPTVDSFEVTNVDWVVNYVRQRFTREIRNRWLQSVFLLQGIFHNFQERLLCIYSTLVFMKLFFKVLNSRLFLHG